MDRFSGLWGKRKAEEAGRGLSNQGQKEMMEQVVLPPRKQEITKGL